MLLVSEGPVSFRGPSEWTGGRGELGEVSCHPAVVPNEAPVKVGKSQEALQEFPGHRNGPLSDGTDLFWVHLPLHPS